MKTLITIVATTVLVACGAQNQDTGHSKTYGCDSSIVAIMSTMAGPSLLGLGAPDRTTYTTQGQNHMLIYEFTLEKKRIEFEYNANYCRETVTDF
jgi:hypothetical protein